MRARAQTSVELLIVLAISIILLSLLVNLTTTQVGQLRSESSTRIATQSLSGLIEAINQTYSEGPGTVRFVTVRWPEGIDPDHTQIVGKTIVVRVYTTDIAQAAIPIVTGSLTVYPGEQRIKITANDTNVSLGTLSFTADTSSIYLPMSQDSNAFTHVTFTNLSNVDTNVTFSVTWTPTLVSIAHAPTLQTLTANGTVTVDVNANASSTAFGNYVGFLTASANYGSTVESLSIPLNVEVFSSSSGLLDVFPASISMTSPLGDTNSTTIQVCNSGDTPLTNISFTPSTGNAGDWVSDISTISSISGGNCQNVNVIVTIPTDANYEVETGSLLVSDSTGANAQIVPLSVKVLGQGDIISWDWNSVVLGSSTLSSFGLRNPSSKVLTVTQITMKKWWNCDTNMSKLTTIVTNGNTVYSGTLSDGNVGNVTDFNLTAGVTYTNNTLTFNGTINDENEQFQPVLTMGDGTTYTGLTYGNGCAIDTTPPAAVTDLAALAGPEPGSIDLRFTFPGDNNFLGNPSAAVFKMFKRPDANSASVYTTGTDLTYSGTLGPGGTSGHLLVSDLNAGETYYFTSVFYDDKDLNGGLSNIAAGRPSNKYSYRLNDFNVTYFAHSLTSNPPVGQPWDINMFQLSDFNYGGARDRNIAIRITPDNNSNNSWIIVLGIQSTILNRIRIWYPSAATNGVPGGSPTYSLNTSTDISATPINLLSAALINSTVRYDGNAVSMPHENHLYITWLRNITDFNLTFDMNQALYP